MKTKEPARLYYADGNIEEIYPNNGRDFKLEEIQKLIGGYIEFVYLSIDKIMIVDEEGKVKGLPSNVQATKVIRKYGIPDFIVGTAVVCHKNMLK